jgi:hypothetical protein
MLCPFMPKNGRASPHSIASPYIRNEAPVCSSWLERLWPIFRRLVPIVAAGCFLAWCLIALRPDFSWDDAEPEILDQAWHLARGQSIYHSIETPPFTFSVYPPLYYALVALLLKVFGLNYLPAKLLSLVAGCSTVYALMRLKRKWNKTIGLWVVCLLFLIPAFLYNLLRCHVQMLAVALSIWSLVFFLRNRKMETLLVSPLLAVLALYTKQTQIALPLGMALYLAFKNRRWLLPYLSVFIGGALIPFLALQTFTHGTFWLDTVILAELSYQAFMIPLIFLHHAGPILVFLAIACATLWKRVRSFDLEPVDCYFGCVLLTTLVSLGRAGAHSQYVLELIIVTVIYLLRTTDLFAVQSRKAWVSIQVLLLLAYAPFFVFFEEGKWDSAANRASRHVYAAIREHPGPILSQQSSFALFGHGEIYVALFHFTALARLGEWDQAHIVNSIRNREFPYVIMQFRVDNADLSDDDRERFTPEMISSIRKHYRLEKVIYPYFLYTPVSTVKNELHSDDHSSTIGHKPRRWGGLG